MKQVIQVKPSISRWLAPAGFVIFSVLMAVFSRGFLEADELTHFLESRSVWSNWVGITDIWGRMGCTGLYALAAPLGLTAARLLAVGVMTLTGLGTGVVARHFVETRGPGARESWIARHAVAIVWLLLFAQPFFALNSFTVMTEMLLACPWIWTVAALIRLRDRPDRGVILAGAVLGLGGLMRPEGWIAVAAWPVFVFFWLRQNDAIDNARKGFAQRLPVLVCSCFAAGLPSLGWYVLGAIGHSSNGYGDWKWVITYWPWEAKGKYESSLLIFVQRSMVAMAIWMWVPIAVGIMGFLRRPRGGSRWVNDGRMLLAAPLAGLFFVHGVLGSFGLFATMALPRYYISVAPMAAVLAMLGLIWMERFLTIGRGIPFRAAVILLPAATLGLLMSMKLLPMAESPEMRRLDVVIAELKERVPAGQYQERIIASHPYVIWALGLPLGTRVEGTLSNPEAMAELPMGTLLVTDSMLWVAEHRPPPERLTAWGFVVDKGVAARVDAATMESEPWAKNWPRPGKVRLWIKVHPAVSGTIPATISGK